MPINKIQPGNVSTTNQSSGGGGTSDYTDLSNKPKINGVTLSGNKTSEDLNINYSDENYIESKTYSVGSGESNDFHTFAEVLVFITKKWSNGEVVFKFASETFNIGDEPIELPYCNIPKVRFEGSYQNASSSANNASIAEGQVTVFKSGVTGTNFAISNKKKNLLYEFKHLRLQQKNNAKAGRGFVTDCQGMLLLDDIAVWYFDYGVFGRDLGSISLQNFIDVQNCRLGIASQVGCSISTGNSAQFQLTSVTTGFAVGMGGMIYLGNTTIKKSASVTNVFSNTVNTVSSGGLISGTYTEQPMT